MRLFILLLILMVSLRDSSASSSLVFKYRTFAADDPELWETSVEHSLDFFRQHARAGDTGAFFSEVACDGTVRDDTVHVLALSRLIYALAWSSETHPAALEEARQAARFLTEKMITRDRLGPRFVATVSLSRPLQPEKQVHVWEQAYGLCGLVELYRHTHDSALLALIRELHQSLLQRFRIEGTVSELAMDVRLSDGRQSGRGYASIVYPATAYLINLHEADVERRSDYAPLLADTLARAEALWDESSGWVKEGPGDNAHAVPGHSFQLAWLFMRASEWGFLPSGTRSQNRSLGLHILERTLGQEKAWDAEHAGLFGKVSLNGASSEPPQKDWWQHCEALPALACAYRLTHEQAWLEQLNRTGQFYFNAFFDLKGGGEFFAVDAENRPRLDLNKGSKGKSSYHVAEAARFVTAYLRDEESACK